MSAPAAAPAAVPPRVPRWRAALRRRPFTVAFAVVLAAVFAIGLTPARRLVFAPIAGLDPAAIADQRWWSLVTSLVVAGSAVQFVLALALTIVGVGWVEGLLGWRRTLLAVVVTGVVGSMLGIGLESLGLAVHEYWASNVRGVVVLDPLTPIAGTIAWGTAAASTLWRRRVRVLLVSVAAALLLYSGRPEDLYVLIAIGVGWAGGRLTQGPAPRAARSVHETRTLLAVATTVFAIGPVLTLASATRYGALSPLGVAVLGAEPNGRAHPLQCVAGHIALGCARELTREPVHGVGATLVALLPLVLMLVAARGIVAGRRLALLLLAAFAVAEAFAAAVYFGLVPAFDPHWSLPALSQRYWELSLWIGVSTLVPLGFAIVLLVLRRATPVLPSRRRVAAFAGVIVAAVVLPGILYVGGGLLARHGFRPTATLGRLLDEFSDRLVPTSFLRHETPELRPMSPVAHLLTQGVGPLFWVLVIVAAVIGLGGRARLAVESPEAERIRGLLRTRSTSLGWMGTWAGNRLWTTPDGSAGIAYRLIEGSTAITVGDPFGAGDPDAVLDGFLAHCDAAAWTPVFYSVHDDWRARLATRGWSSVEVAEEALLDPQTFTTAGKKMQDIRTSANRAARLGIVARWARWSELPLRITTQIDAVSEEWMGEKDLPEMGFTLGGVDEARDDEVVLGVAVDAEQHVLAITSWMPFFRNGVVVGRTLDLLRRTPDSPNGVTEFLIADGMERFREQGVEVVSLSGAPLAGSDELPGALGRILSLVGRSLEPVYGFRSLLRFKTKFGASLAPMWLCFRDPVELPRIGVAIGRAYLPGLTLAQAMRVMTGGDARKK